MPAKSKSQLGFIYSKRNKYGSRKDTPKRWKWVWGKEWTDVNYKKLPEKVSEHIITKFDDFINENIKDYLKPKSKEEIGYLMKNGNQKLEIPNGYTEKQTKNIISRYSKELNKNFINLSKICSVDWLYEWRVPSDYNNKITLNINKSNGVYFINFSDQRDYSLKKIKNYFSSVIDYSDYQFIKKFYYLEHALDFLNDCGIDTSKIKENGALSESKTISRQKLSKIHGIKEKELDILIKVALKFERKHTDDSEVAMDIVLKNLEKNPRYYQDKFGDQEIDKMIKQIEREEKNKNEE